MMDVSLKHNRQMRSFAIAMIAAIFAAVATMFIPVAALETVTGATGLSELVPATAAPLGDTARALIAFGAGAVTLAALLLLLLRSDPKPVRTVPDDFPAANPQDADDDLAPSLAGRFAKFKWPAISLPKMPWVKDEDDITDLADLPKLRGNDIHPDAPPRRPLSATSDLPVLELAPIQIEVLVEEQPAQMSDADPIVPVAVVDEPSTPVEQPSNDHQPSLAEMVAQLEAAVTYRQQQLVELETVAAKLAAEKPVELVAEPDAMPVSEVAAEVEILTEPVRTERPPLEAVPSSPAQQDDMDAALAAALATLHRMNGTDR